MASLFDKLGGEGAISLVIDRFYEYMLDDPKIKAYFEKIDM
jgi:truncated hemoglobin YjbI